MQAIVWLGVPLAAVLALPAVASDITFYEHDSFRGRSFVVNQSISNLANVGYNDRASSVVVGSGTWQICTDAYFRGRCATVSRGQYPTLSTMGLNDAVSSARELDWLGGAPGGGAGAGGRVELFEGREFSSRTIAVTGSIRNFADVEFNDRAASMIIYEGTWELCADADFRGACETYGPGRYPDLGAFHHRLSSIRPTSGVRGGWGGPGGGGWGTGSRAILYEGPSMSGRSYTINNQVASNLATTGFNDRAASLRIEGGYWLFCSEAQFEGECQTFGPGDYPNLGGGLNNRISSGRRINSQYPYSQNPMWQRP
jgi:hypothetical protein